MLQPEIKRSGLSMRFTANIGENAQFYAMANFYKTDTFASFTPLGFNGTPPPPNPRPGRRQRHPAGLRLLAGVGTFNGVGTGCDATNGTLNPVQPLRRRRVSARSCCSFAVSAAPSKPDSRAIRAVAGIDGTSAKTGATRPPSRLPKWASTAIQNNYLIPQRIWDVAAQGTFNFADPYATPQEVWDYIAPRQQHAFRVAAVADPGHDRQGTVRLPGGPHAGCGRRLRIARSRSTRRAPIPANDLGAVHALLLDQRGRHVRQPRREVGLLRDSARRCSSSSSLVASGRFDEYSTGQSNFSPKFGFKFTPIEQLAFRGTFSKGFRIPSFNEASVCRPPAM